MDTIGKVTAATSSKTYLFIATSKREIIVYQIGHEWRLERTIATLHASTAMDVLDDRVLVYALGDEGYGLC